MLMGLRGPKPLSIEELERRGSWLAPARRKEKRLELEVERRCGRPRTKFRRPPIAAIIKELPGYDPFRHSRFYRFDADRAIAAIRWFHDHLTHTKGRWARGPDEFKLRRWQMAIVGNLFGWVHRKTGLRRYRRVFIYVPRKNGKTTMVAGIVNLVGMVDEEPGAELYSAAADREQARLIFTAARQMVKQDDGLADSVEVYHNSMLYPMDGLYKALSREAGTKHGLNPSLVAVDELHAQNDRELVDVLETGMGSRDQPITLYITTADWDRESICNETYEYACRVRDGFDDPEFLPCIWEAGKDDDWTKPETWKKANPNFDLLKAYLRGECRKAQESAAVENRFKRLHLNIRTQQEVLWLRMERWEACGKADVDPADLKGRECWAALDIGATSDLTALCLLFPDDAGERITLLWWFWSPRDTARKRQRKDRVPYETWAAEGWMKLTDGDETDYGRVRADINALTEDYVIREIAVDRLFQGAEFCQNLAKDGFEVIAFPQTMPSMAAPTKEFERLVNKALLSHGRNPIARWMAQNVMVKEDGEGNYKPDKKRTRQKIDGIVASIMALGRWMVRDRADTGSVYDDRGILTI